MVLTWNIQSPHEGNCPVTPMKCTKSAHRGTGKIYDTYRFDIGRFRADPTDLRKVSTSEWHICISQCPNNLFHTLRVIHKLKNSFQSSKKNKRKLFTKDFLNKEEKRDICYTHRSHTVNFSGSIINVARGSDSEPGQKHCKAAEVWITISAKVCSCELFPGKTRSSLNWSPCLFLRSCLAKGWT